MVILACLQLSPPRQPQSGSPEALPFVHKEAAQLLCLPTGPLTKATEGGCLPSLLEAQNQQPLLVPIHMVFIYFQVMYQKKSVKGQWLHNKILQLLNCKVNKSQLFCFSQFVCLYCHKKKKKKKGHTSAGDQHQSFLFFSPTVDCSKHICNIACYYFIHTLLIEPNTLKFSSPE